MVMICKKGAKQPILTIYTSSRATSHFLTKLIINDTQWDKKPRAIYKPRSPTIYNEIIFPQML